MLLKFSLLVFPSLKRLWHLRGYKKTKSTFPESSCHFCFKVNSKLLIRVFQYVFESSPSPQSCTFPKSLRIKIVLGISKINLFDLLGVVRSPYFFQICLSWAQTRALHVFCGTVCLSTQPATHWAVNDVGTDH